MAAQFLKQNERVIEIARSWIGTPYHHGACVKGIGCDCLGLLEAIWEALYAQPAPYRKKVGEDWYINQPNALIDAANLYLSALQKAEIGCVVLMCLGRSQAANHCGILTEKQTIIHAYNAHGSGVNAVTEMPFQAPFSKNICGYWQYEKEIK